MSLVQRVAEVRVVCVASRPQTALLRTLRAARSSPSLSPTQRARVAAAHSHRSTLLVASALSPVRLSFPLHLQIREAPFVGCRHLPRDSQQRCLHAHHVRPAPMHTDALRPPKIATARHTSRRMPSRPEFQRAVDADGEARCPRRGSRTLLRPPPRLRRPHNIRNCSRRSSTSQPLLHGVLLAPLHRPVLPPPREVDFRAPPKARARQPTSKLLDISAQL
ncbi:hypothetical protein T484DRAFT_1972644 [Baffinella frigidus]|nr:hypothetical protein T484DRAFT_1972644 [Cryptophyta sp. CCMP2293]